MDQEFETGIPLEKSGAFQNEFRFVVAQRHFDLPATRISENDFSRRVQENGQVQKVSRYQGDWPLRERPRARG